ncbi:MAG TPA: sialidase family protein, partial [Bacteroidota bacterium]|nr:sialidase family protein [Bacteroidota bacterium]
MLSIAPGVATSGDTVHVIWYGADTIGGTPNSGIEYSRSTDNGNSFSIQTTVVPATTAFSPGLIFCSGKIVCITYFGSVNGLTGTVVTSSTDGGMTWKVPELVQSNAFPR